MLSESVAQRITLAIAFLLVTRTFSIRNRIAFNSSLLLTGKSVGVSKRQPTTGASALYRQLLRTRRQRPRRRATPALRVRIDLRREYSRGCSEGLTEQAIGRLHLGGFHRASSFRLCVG